MEILITILTQSLPVCLMAIGIFITFRLLDFADMTAEGSFLIGGAITVVAIKAGVNPFIATLLAFLGGAGCGALTGVLNRVLKIPKLLSGIITMTACGGLVFLVMGWNPAQENFNSAVRLIDESTMYNIFSFGGDNRWIEIIIMSLVLVIILVAIYFFFGTEYGMAIRATGMNERMARAQGINTTVSTIVCIAISNAIIALSAALIVQEGSEVKLGIESGRLVIGLAAVLMGESIFGKRSFKNWLISVTLGAFIYYAIITLVTNVGSIQFQNVMDKLRKLIYAILIVFALCLPMIKTGFKKLRAPKPVDPDLVEDAPVVEEQSQESEAK